MDLNEQVQINNLIKSGDRQLLRANEIAQQLGLSVETVYDWKYRANKRKIPPGMFVKIGKMLFINVIVFNAWLISQNTIF